jgi:hypothetical protein
MTTQIDRPTRDLLLQARGLELVHGLLAARGASDEELDAHAAELARVRRALAQRVTEALI